jgi:NitT/TauT family transport system permease protein
MNRFTLSALPLICLLIFLEISVQTNFIAAFLVPAPSAVALALVEHRSELFTATASTAFSALSGLILSILLGGLFATFLALSTTARKIFYPYAIFFQTVPIIAIAPLLVIWFGYGRSSVIASSVIVSIFPIITSVLTGLLSTDPGLLDLFKIYRASRWDTFFKLKLPAALPFILNGLNTAAGLAIIGAIVGEFISGNGLGSVIEVSRTQYRVDKVFASVLLAAFLGLLSFASLRLLSRRLLRNWHASETNS